MTLRWAVEDDEYRPEYGLLQVRDCCVPGHDAPDDVVDALAALEESEAANYPLGTLARSGVAWLQATVVADEYHRVRLEAHDATPADDAEHWAAVLETPYFCRTGAIYLTWVTGTADGATLPVGTGLFRVRVCRRAADSEGDVWRLQFWPDPAMGPPQWHKRPGPTVGSSRDRVTAQNLSGDLISLLLWTSSATTTVAALATRLRVTVAEVTAAISAQLDRHLRLDAGDLNAPQRPIVLAVAPRPSVPPAVVAVPPPPPPGPPWRPFPAASPAPPTGTGEHWLVAVGPPRMVTYRPPVGAPPRAGYITGGGDLMGWQAGGLAILAQVTQYPGAPIETAHGVLIAGANGTVLVHTDGTIEDLNVPPGSVGCLDEHGRLYAVQEWHLGRRDWYQLHLIDLATGSRRTMPWDESQALVLNAVYDGAVWFNTSMRWRPGHDPAPAPNRVSTIDPESGIALHFDDREGIIITDRAGVSRGFSASYQARLAPGGTHLYEFDHAPPRLVLYDAATSRTTQTYWLPAESHTSPTGPLPPIWEDRTHLLVHVRNGAYEIGSPVLRLDVATGQFEGVPLTGQPEYARLVRPLRRPGYSAGSGGFPPPGNAGAPLRQNG